MRAYLDIETALSGAISIIGIYRADLGTIQLVDGGVNDIRLYEALEGASTLVTFNGSGFDLPQIRRRLQIDLRQDFQHDDLMYACRRRGLRGGLKHIETLLGIARSTSGVTGRDAPFLWQRYEWGDREALRLLLRYNREDVINLAELDAVMHGMLRTEPEPAIRIVWS